MNATERRIDDQDKSIDYSQPLLGVGSKDWLNNGGSNEYMNTTSLTHKKGASAKLTFTGSSVAVYGTVSSLSDDSGTSSQYSIDGSTSGIYTTKPAKDAQYSVRFFQSNTLKHGQHTLEVVNETKDGWLWLDYFVVSEDGSNSTSTTASTTAASTTSSTSAVPSTSFTPPPDILPSTTPSHSMSTVYVSTPDPSTTASSEDISDPTGGSRHHDGPPAGVILGGTFGSIFGILFIAIIIWIVRRKLADRFADEAAAIPVSAPQSPSNTYKFAYSPPRAPSPNPSMIQDHRGYEPNTPVRASKGYPFGTAAGGVQTSYYQNHAPQSPLSPIHQLQPCSRPASSHSFRNVATPDMRPTQTDVFSAGIQRQSSYIPPPAYPGPPGLHIEMRSEKEAV
ncbi:hypothetical protein AGABI2DRAFT_193616 [Agaricus bisporus var. bisporus H97]|uniref:hypothetical protein n=1 Tax=Agaricus bisporus var. bisporus (strain H97 / ATCC MYA-4626 / FGSC 10389) TaxID=936046 RepID=UPI00029F511E|nr:hypothetical protein AGABI2DRAFT_193616 [Agaricus bisporus var. bisporus H97]EKV45660.1 hypothetical protein AGABI2DRAFT_193616 [Agaricus bisporus var. bisporus H97]